MIKYKNFVMTHKWLIWKYDESITLQYCQEVNEIFDNYCSIKGLQIAFYKLSELHIDFLTDWIVEIQPNSQQKLIEDSVIRDIFKDFSVFDLTKEKKESLYQQIKQLYEND